MSDGRELPRIFGGFKLAATVALVVGTLALALTASQSTEAFFRSYLFGYLFVLGFGLGSMGLLMLHHLVGGAWGFIIQRILEAGVSTVPFLTVLFIPIVFGAGDLYHWMDAEAVAHDHLLSHKAPYLDFSFWVVRAAVYFVIWNAIAYQLVAWSKKQDRTGDGFLSNRMSALSGPGMVLYFLTMTFASFDWAMSLEPHWFSTIYGLIFVEDQALTAMAFAIIVLAYARRNEAVGDAATVERIHDLGKIQFALVALWAYLNFSQFVIIWYANLPEESVWYIRRIHGGYEFLAVFIIFGQFVLPFMLLLTRFTKRRMATLSSIAAFLIVMRLIDLYWFVMPTEHHPTLQLTWGDVGAPLGLFGAWFLVFVSMFGRRTLIVERDPRWMEKLAHEHAH
ncbi:MAG: hypothetical protein ACFB9M_04205 [Myxococcota bacterium]